MPKEIFKNILQFFPSFFILSQTNLSLPARLLLKLLSVSLHFHENISFILFLSNSMMKPNVKPYAVSTERVLLAGSLFLVLFTSVSLLKLS
ncbi:uncharacterized protein IAS62_006552 [Cryptococcus decagattii]|uniref:Uncharacterized protein n=1 Tax=Cryptococcus decagattii TaxID=1859122 RepID=A0ABZ2B2W3_9TREE